MKQETVLALDKNIVYITLCNIEDQTMRDKIISIYFNDNIIPMSSSDLNKIISNYDNIYFLPRAVAEINTNFMHIIPYVVIRYKEKFLSYWRNVKAGESRLHNKMSLGFGGHVNTRSIKHYKDSEKINIQETLTDNINQELTEELHDRLLLGNTLYPDIITNIESVKRVDNKNYIKLYADKRMTMLGVIMSGSSEVNSVHMGLVLMLHWDEVRLGTLNRTVNTDGIDTFNYYTIDELQQFMPSMESWSQMVLRFLMDAEFIYD